MKPDSDSLGDRMKGYEHQTRNFIPPKSYAIIRLDGCHFHTFTRHCVKPYDQELREAMTGTMIELVKSIQGAKLSYHQSDEISLLLTDFETENTCAWYGGNIQKIASVSASIATASFNAQYENVTGQLAYFDARVFTLPTQIEVMNYFLWRIQDAERNSISGLAQANFSQKQLMGKSKAEQKAMLLEQEVDWDAQPWWNRKGTIYLKDGSEFLPPPDDKFDMLPWIPLKPGEAFTSVGNLQIGFLE